MFRMMDSKFPPTPIPYNNLDRGLFPLTTIRVIVDSIGGVSGVSIHDGLKIEPPGQKQ